MTNVKLNDQNVENVSIRSIKIPENPLKFGDRFQRDYNKAKQNGAQTHEEAWNYAWRNGFYWNEKQPNPYKET